MKYLILVLTLLLPACNTDAKVIKAPVVDGKVYGRFSYACEFGVLYSWGYEKVAMYDREDKPIPCTIESMTKKEYKSRVQ